MYIFSLFLFFFPVFGWSSPSLLSTHHSLAEAASLLTTATTSPPPPTAGNFFQKLDKFLLFVTGG